MKICMIYSPRFSRIHGQFDVPGLYESAGLTGSESSFFNLAWGLAELGHEVRASCDTPTSHLNVEKLAGASVLPISEIRNDADVYISWLEPDLLRHLPADRLRICAQQLNDFDYCKPDFDRHVDAYVCPSISHADHLAKKHGLRRSKFAVIWNSINPEFTARTDIPREKHRMAWLSSPDRGLHRMLQIFPLVRQQIPDATLHIYYRVKDWFERCQSAQDAHGVLARQIQGQLDELGTRGENGVHLHDCVPNRQMAQELLRTELVAYPCEPMGFTEGFGVSVADATAAGCLTLLSDADAFPEIYGQSSIFIRGLPAAQINTWAMAIVELLNNPPTGVVEHGREMVARFARDKVARTWETLLVSAAEKRRSDSQVFFQVERPRQDLRMAFALERRPPVDTAVMCPWAHALRAFDTEFVKTHTATKTHSFRGRPFQVRYNPSVPNHPTDFSFIDEQEVREAWWDIKPGDVVLDIGAAYGSYTMAALVSGAEHVFSWAPEETRVLGFTVWDNGFEDRCTIMEGGLWSERGVLAIRDGDAPAVLCKSRQEAMEIISRHEGLASIFNVKDLDSYMLAIRPPRIDWVKLDVEGAEHMVLQGGLQTIRRYRPRIFLENHLFKDGEIANKCRTFLEALGYRHGGTRPHGLVSHSIYQP